MFISDLHIDQERVVSDLRKAVDGVRYALAAPEYLIRRAAFEMALRQLEDAVKAAKAVNLHG